MSSKNVGETSPVAEAAFDQGHQDGSTVTISSDQPQATATEDPAPAPSSDRMFSVEDIEKARQQEKDKLYGRIEKLQSQVESFAEMTEAQKAEEALRQQEAEEHRRLQEIEEMSAKDAVRAIEDDLRSKMTEMSSEYEAKLEAIQAELQAKDAILEREREYAELQHHKTVLMQQYGDDIIPHLRDMVAGNTKEEMEASVSSLVERSNAIMEDAQQALQPQRVRGVPATGGSTTGPVETQTETQTLTDSDIRDMSMEDYSKMRDRLLQQARPRN